MGREFEGGIWKDLAREEQTNGAQELRRYIWKENSMFLPIGSVTLEKNTNVSIGSDVRGMNEQG